MVQNNAIKSNALLEWVWRAADGSVVHANARDVKVGLLTMHNLYNAVLK